MLTADSLDNETILVAPDQSHHTVEELRNRFEQRRYDDDEFARDYRRGEFVNWLNDQGYEELL
jgi:hypothetical protein